MAQFWLQFGLHDSLYQIKSDYSLCLYPIIRGKTRFPFLYQWTFYQIQSLGLLSIINFLVCCPRGKTIFVMVFATFFSWVVQRGPEQWYPRHGGAKYGNEALTVDTMHEMYHIYSLVSFKTSSTTPRSFESVCIVAKWPHSLDSPESKVEDFWSHQDKPKGPNATLEAMIAVQLFTIWQHSKKVDNFSCLLGTKAQRWRPLSQSPFQ